MADPPKAPAADASKSDAPKVKDIGGTFSEVFAAIMTAVAGATVAGVSVLHKGGLAKLETALLNASDDVQFMLRHSGVVRARRILAFWQACIIIVLGILISVVFTHDLFLATAPSIVVFLLAATLSAALQVYAWPVQDVGFFDHRRAREPVDRVRTRVLHLQALRDAKDPSFSQGDLDLAEIELRDEQGKYNQFVFDQGPNTRDASRIMWWGFWSCAIMGLALLYGVVGSHDGGPHTYMEVVYYIALICLLPVPILLIPLLLVIWAIPFVFRQISKAEDTLTFVRRLVKAALIVGEDYGDILAQELQASADNGDDVHRNSMQIALQRMTSSLGVLGLKVLCAIALVIQHALFFPSTMAFGLSIFLVFFTNFLQAVIEKHNKFVEEHPLIIRGLGGVGGFLIYLHLYLAGGAPEGFRGPGWWWSDYGPFADIVGPSSVAENYDTARGGVGHAAHAVAEPVSHFSTALGHMTFARAIAWLVMVIILVFLGAKGFRHASEEVDKTPLPLIKRGGTYVLAVVAGLFALIMLIVAFKAPGRFDDEPQTPVQQELSAEVSHAIASVDLSRACALRDNRTRCTLSCYQYHGRVPNGGIAHERSEGLCYSY